jgi:hypothetical protein
MKRPPAVSPTPEPMLDKDSTMRSGASTRSVRTPKIRPAHSKGAVKPRRSIWTRLYTLLRSHLLSSGRTGDYRHRRISSTRKSLLHHEVGAGTLTKAIVKMPHTIFSIAA